MRQLANILQDSSPARKPHNPATAQRPTTSPSVASPTGASPYSSDGWVLEQLAAFKRTPQGRTMRGSARLAALLFRVVRRRGGTMRTTLAALAWMLGGVSPHTVRSAALVLEAAGFLLPPASTRNGRGYVNGVAYTLRREDAAAWCVNLRAQELTIKSSTTKSSALRAPSPRPPDEATWGQTVKAASVLHDEHEAAKAQGKPVPDNLPDRAEALRLWMSTRARWTTSEQWRRSAIDYVDRRARLHAVGRMPGSPGQTRQEPARATNGVGVGVDVGVPHAAAPAARIQAPVTAELQSAPLRPVGTPIRVLDELRAAIVDTLAVLPPATLAVLRALVWPELSAQLRRCPALSERDRPRFEQAAIVTRVLHELRGRSPDETIAALLADARLARCG